MDTFARVTDIKVWLLKAGYNQARIAKDLGVSRPTVWRAIHKKDRNRRVEQWLKDHGCPERLI